MRRGSRPDRQEDPIRPRTVSLLNRFALALLIVFAVVPVIEGYVLTPRIMGSRTGLHPMVIIVAIFFWGAALDGILGMILAIPLTAFLVVFWRLAKEKYIGELL